MINLDYEVNVVVYRNKHLLDNWHALESAKPTSEKIRDILGARYLSLCQVAFSIFCLQKKEDNKLLCSIGIKCHWNHIERGSRVKADLRHGSCILKIVADSFQVRHFVESVLIFSINHPRVKLWEPISGGRGTHVWFEIKAFSRHRGLEISRVKIQWYTVLAQVQGTCLCELWGNKKFEISEVRDMFFCQKLSRNLCHLMQRTKSILPGKTIY